MFNSGAYSQSHHELCQTLEECSIGSKELKYFKLKLFNELSLANLSSNKLSEQLVMLLNCDLLDDYIDSSPQYSMKRGLYHAISLIERSRSIEERKIGYLYITLHAPFNDNDWPLMMINTLKKDLESVDHGSILIALKFLIERPFIEILPAINGTLIKLLHHQKKLIRLRSSEAINKLLEIVDDKDEAYIDFDKLFEFINIDYNDGLEVCKHNLRKQLIKFEYGPSTSQQQQDTMLDSSKDIDKFMKLHLFDVLSKWNQDDNNENFFKFLFDHTLHSKSRYKGGLMMNVIKYARSDNDFKLCLNYIQQHLIHDANSAEPNQRYEILCKLSNIPSHILNENLAEFETQFILDGLNNYDSTLRIKTLELVSKIDKNLLHQYYQILLNSNNPILLNECQKFI